MIHTWVRLRHALQLELRLQARYGFYFVSIVMVIIWIGVAVLLPDNIRYDLLLPAFALINMLLTTFYFMGGLILFEKAERVLSALVITPLHPAEYLVARITALVGLATLETVFVIFMIVGADVNLFWLLIGIVTAGIIYALAGFITIARYEFIESYLLPSALVTAFLFLPLLFQLDVFTSVLFYLHPMNPPMMLLRAAFTDVTALEVAYVVPASLGWISGLSWWALGVHRRYLVVRAL